MNRIGYIALTRLVLGMTGCNKFSADRTRGLSGTCEVYGMHTAKTNVPIAYGLIPLNEYGRARQVERLTRASECVP